MARDDSDHEDESLLSAEEAASDGTKSCHREDEDSELTDNDSNEAEDDEDERPRKTRPGAKATTVPTGRPPKPPGAGTAPRLGAGRSLRGAGPGSSRPSLPARPAVSRLLDDVDEDDAGGVGPLSEAALQKRREENIRALVSNSLQTCRQPLMSKFLTVMEGEVTLRKPFQSPMQGAPRMSDALRRKLVARRHFVPWGSSTPLPIPTCAVKPLPLTPVTPCLPEPPPEPPAPAPEPALPEGIEPLILWQAPHEQQQPEGAGGADAGAPGGGGDPVSVDPMLVRFLRPHQREGVQFMFDCVTGQRLEGRQGCILADDMGLGKTLQGITLLWTLLNGGHPLLGGAPIARRVIIVCPTSLVSNWDNECTKWLQGRLKTLAMCESSREDVVANIGLFLQPANAYKVLIISYETFRMHAERFQVPHACDLLLCDEAHRLKNDATLTNRALDNLPCKRRVLLSGTPMQNHLDEFFAMVDFCNPGVLGVPAQFRKYYEVPILAGREPDASLEQVVLGEERSRELSGLTNNFILRRTNKLLSQHLPPKVIEVVCCRLTELQRQLYGHFLQSKAARRVLNGRTASGVLSAITSLKKLCNHPKLIYDAVHSKTGAVAGGGGDDGEGGGGRAEGFEDVGSLFPPGLFDNGRVGRGGMAAGWEAVSGKMSVLGRMLHVLYSETTDRIVLVSNYTSTLDLFVQLCRERGYPFVRLDGTTTINKRQKLVKMFNDPAERQFAFLLSSKAGGCGLNLIGANRLVLFDPDWNPANDQQAAARVWRDGQRKRVFVYRFLSTGSIEEKVYQRQLSKEGLKQLVSKNGKAAANVMTSEDLRELFTLSADTWSDTYDYMCGGPGTAAEVPMLPSSSAARAGSPIDLSAGTGSESEDDPHDTAAEDGGGAKAAGARGGGRRGTAAAAPAGGSEREGGGGEGADGNPFARLPPVHKKQLGEPAEEDLANWGHHPSPETVPDAVMRRVAGPDVSFIFSCSVAGKPIEGGDEEEGRLAAGAAAGTGAAAATPAAAARAAGGGAACGRGLRGSSGRVLGGAGVPRPGAPAAGTPAGPGAAAAPLALKTPGCVTPAAPAPSAATAAARSSTALVTPHGSGPPTTKPQVAPACAAPRTAGAATAAAAVARGQRRQPQAAAAAPPAITDPTRTTAVPVVISPTDSGGAPSVSPSGAAAAAPSAVLRSQPQKSQPQAAPDSGAPIGGPVVRNTAAGTAPAAAAAGGGGSSRPHSSVTGAVVSPAAVLAAAGGGSCGASGRRIARGGGGGGPAAPPAVGGAAKPAAAAVAAVAAQPKAQCASAAAAVGTTIEPLRNSAGPNSQSRLAVPAAGAAAAAAAARMGAAAGVKPLGAAAVSGATGAATKLDGTAVPQRQQQQGQSKLAGARPGQVAAAAGAIGGGASGVVRGRAFMECGGGGPGQPKPKKQRPPGTYIDSDDDFL